MATPGFRRTLTVELSKSKNNKQSTKPYIIVTSAYPVCLIKPFQERFLQKKMIVRSAVIWSACIYSSGLIGD